MDILLSILVPSVFERWPRAVPLAEKLSRLATGKPVEVLWFTDNRQRKLGKKREGLIGLARGRFICHIDDDDMVTDDFVDVILAAITANPDADVISYQQMVIVAETGATFRVTTGLDLPNEPVRKDDAGNWCDITRKPWHWCTWRTELVRQAACQDGNVDEDWFWVQQLLPLVKREVHLPDVLHKYTWDVKSSLCQE